MTNKEAIEMQEAIKAGLKETGKDHPYRDALIPLMKESCDIAIEALEAQDRQAIIAGSYLLEGKDTNVPSKGTVSRQQVLDALDRFSLGETDVAKLTFRLRDYLMRLPSAELEQRWIPCSERLPSEGENVLLCDTLFGNVAIGKLIRYNTSCCWEVDHWDCDIEDWQAWMPLPEPYKEA